MKTLANCLVTIQLAAARDLLEDITLTTFVVFDSLDKAFKAAAAAP